MKLVRIKQRPIDVEFYSHVAKEASHIQYYFFCIRFQHRKFPTHKHTNTHTVDRLMDH